MSIRVGTEIYDGKKWGVVTRLAAQTLYEVQFSTESEPRLVHYNHVLNYRNPKSEASSNPVGLPEPAV